MLTHIAFTHPVLPLTHYVVFRNGIVETDNSADHGVRLTADPRLFVSCRTKVGIDKVATRVNPKGHVLAGEYTFVPCVHPATLADHIASLPKPSRTFPLDPMEDYRGDHDPGL